MQKAPWSFETPPTGSGVTWRHCGHGRLCPSCFTRRCRHCSQYTWKHWSSLGCLYGSRHIPQVTRSWIFWRAFSAAVEGLAAMAASAAEKLGRGWRGKEGKLIRKQPLIAVTLPIIHSLRCAPQTCPTIFGGFCDIIMNTEKSPEFRIVQSNSSVKSGRNLWLPNNV